MSITTQTYQGTTPSVMLHPDSHWLTSLLKELTVWRTGIHVDPIDYGNVPGCTYASPEIASVGLTEKQARKRTN
jgi:hypothetical protein